MCYVSILATWKAEAIESPEPMSLRLACAIQEDPISKTNKQTLIYSDECFGRKEIIVQIKTL